MKMAEAPGSFADMSLPWGHETKLQYLFPLLSILLHSSSLLSHLSSHWLPHSIPSSPSHHPEPSSLHFLTPSLINHFVPSLSYLSLSSIPLSSTFPSEQPYSLDRGYSWVATFTMITRKKMSSLLQGSMDELAIRTFSLSTLIPVLSQVLLPIIFLGHTTGCPKRSTYLLATTQLPSQIEICNRS